MIDIQGSEDGRGLAIDDVGISGLRQVVLTGDRSNEYRGVADLTLGVRLPAEARGTHMSRLVELIQEHSEDLTVEALPVVTKRLLGSLNATAGRLDVSFPLVVSQASPVTGLAGTNVHDAKISARRDGDLLTLELMTEVLATSLCPCSKAISDYGAHNQRSRIRLSIALQGDDAATRLPTLQEMVRWSEDASSCPIYPLLKRPDERHITMAAHDKPAFVEDIARDLSGEAARLEGPGRVQVRVTNEESIHRHDAYASLSRLLA